MYSLFLLLVVSGVSLLLLFTEVLILSLGFFHQCHYCLWLVVRAAFLLHWHYSYWTLKSVSCV